MSPYTHDVLVSKEWVDDLTEQLHDLRSWIMNPVNVDDTLEELADLLVSKHHDYGEDNLVAFGELGILVRATDKAARLKNLLDKQGVVSGESREDTWRDLAGYAIQALILMKRTKSTERVDILEIRKNRLNMGLCPDCGEGFLLRRQQWDMSMTINLFCSDYCGFQISVDWFDMDHDPQRTIQRIAAREAAKEQK